LYHIAADGGTWWIGTTVGKNAGKLNVDNESAERPDEIRGGWQEYDGKEWAAAAGVTVVARAHIGRGVPASSIKVIDDEQAASAAAAAAEVAAAAAAAAAAATGGMAFLETAVWWPRAGKHVVVRVVTMKGLEEVMYGVVEAEEDGGCFRVAYTAGRYDCMEVRGATGRLSSQRMGLYQWTHERSNGRQVYKHETNDYYLYHIAGTGGTWWINDTVGEDEGWLQVNNKSAERPDEISGGWQEYNGKEWLAAAGVTVVARAHIGRGVTASSIKVIDDEQAAKANAAAAAEIAAVAAAAAHAAATTAGGRGGDRMEAALLALRLPPSNDSAEAAKQRAEVGGVLEAAADGDGTVTAHELASVASQLGLRLPSPLPDALLKLFCDEGQGQVVTKTPLLASCMEVARNQVGALKAAHGAVCRRRRASRRLAVPRRGAPRKKWPVSLGCRGLLGPPGGVWGRENAPRG
jgi:hypothetical protein